MGIFGNGYIIESDGFLSKVKNEINKLNSRHYGHRVEDLRTIIYYRNDNDEKIEIGYVNNLGPYRPDYDAIDEKIKTYKIEQGEKLMKKFGINRNY